MKGFLLFDILKVSIKDKIAENLNPDCVLEATDRRISGSWNRNITGNIQGSFVALTFNSIILESISVTTNPELVVGLVSTRHCSNLTHLDNICCW